MGTQRTLATLQGLLADNTTGDISPQDLRDLVETLAHDHGELSISSPVETTIDTVDVWKKMAGTTVISPGVNHHFDMPVDNRLRFTGDADRLMHIAVSIGVTPAASNKTLEFMVAKNGNAADVNSLPSVIQMTLPNQNITVATTLHAFIPMSPNDYIEVWCRNVTDATNLTAETLNFVAIGMPAMS